MRARNLSGLAGSIRTFTPVSTHVCPPLIPLFALLTPLADFSNKRRANRVIPASLQTRQGPGFVRNSVRARARRLTVGTWAWRGPHGQAGATGCTSCGKGEAPNAEQSDCLQCFPGSFCRSQPCMECLLCSEGTYQASEAQEACMPCERGTLRPRDAVGRCYGPATDRRRPRPSPVMQDRTAQGRAL